MTAGGGLPPSQISGAVTEIKQLCFQKMQKIKCTYHQLGLASVCRKLLTDELTIGYRKYPNPLCNLLGQ